MIYKKIARFKNATKATVTSIFKIKFFFFPIVASCYIRRREQTFQRVWNEPFLRKMMLKFQQFRMLLQSAIFLFFYTHDQNHAENRTESCRLFDYMLQLVGTSVPDESVCYYIQGVPASRCIQTLSVCVL